VLTVTAGLVALVYGFSQAAAHGWASAEVVASLAAGAALIAAFGVIESRAASPILPLRILADRNRGGSYLTVSLSVIGMYGLFLLLSYYFQAVRGYSPARAGVAFLPLSAAVLLGSTVVARKLLPLVRPRLLIVPGLLVGTAGMATLTRLGPGSGYLAHVLPGELLLGLGMGCVFMPAIQALKSETASASTMLLASGGMAVPSTADIRLSTIEVSGLCGASSFAPWIFNASIGATPISFCMAIGVLKRPSQSPRAEPCGLWHCEQLASR